MQTFYLLAAIVGTVLPWVGFLPFLVENSPWPETILTALYANGATAGLSTDFFLTCGVFWIFVIREARQIGLKGWFFVLPSAPHDRSVDGSAHLPLSQRASCKS